MTPEEVSDLFDYDRWAVERQLASAAQLSEGDYRKNLGSSHGGVEGTLVHTFAAQRVWFSRWRGENPAALATPGDLSSLVLLKDSWMDLYSKTRVFTAQLTPAILDAPLHYRDLKNVPHAEPLAYQIRHVLNHSSYHRGQVTTLLRQLGVQPTALDLIVYYRERDALARAAGPA